jgi:hypothetical protein
MVAVEVAIHIRELELGFVNGCFEGHGSGFEL